MNLLILQTWTRLLQPVMFLFAIFLLLRGHDEPGGGFIGGLLASAAFSLGALAYGVETAKREVRFSPQALMTFGLVAALGSGMIGMFYGQPLLTSVWVEFYVPILGDLKVGSPLIFDIGVFAVVIGVTTGVVFSLLEESDAD